MPDVEPQWLDPSRPHEIERYLLDRGLLPPGATPIDVAVAGAGNMNVALRVRPARGRPFIVKQGRPWVAKYPHIEAPLDRTRVEAAFYAEVAGVPAVARMMPAVLHTDVSNHVLVLEDVGTDGDFTSLYAGTTLPTTVLTDLLEWLERLPAVPVPPEDRAVFANRAMRSLNHEHMFRFPLAPYNGLDLDAITPGLADDARELANDRQYCDAVVALGRTYLADGDTLVHGDYFPGSWLNTAGGVRVIDPEFCFLGAPEFDCGILAAHLLFADADAEQLGMVAASIDVRRLDATLAAGYAGVEIMRRLIGVAQLPLRHDVDRKRSLLERSRRLVLEPQKGLA